MKLIITWLVSALAIFLSAWISPGVNISGFGSALIAAIILGAVNSFIRPIILFLTLPINIVTLGFFTLVINAGMVALVAFLVPGFSVAGFWTALIFTIVLSAVSWIMEGVIKEPKK